VGHVQVHAPHELTDEHGDAPAFRAWLAQRPLTDPRAVPGPLSIE
jgi:hypothetical protein